VSYRLGIDVGSTRVFVAEENVEVVDACDYLTDEGELRRRAGASSSAYHLPYVDPGMVVV
jgi:hypothetical protein